MAPNDGEWLARLARQLGAAPNLTLVWDRVVQAAVVEVKGAEYAGITIASRKSVSTPAASDDLVRAIDQQQYATAQGPCLTAATAHQTVVRVGDLTIDTRWPKFSRAVAGLGVRSMLSFQLYTAEETIGALNLYARPAHAFTENSIHIGTLLAAHAAVAAAAAIENAGLRIALESRDVIGQAKGMIMERYKLTAQQAFDLLIRLSQSSNRKLHDVAVALTEQAQTDTRQP